MKKPYRLLALGVIVVIIIFAIGSFLRENWGVNGSPGVLERVIARWALTSSRREDAGTKNPIAPTSESLAEGRSIYEKQCAFCHGLDGRGQVQQSGLQFYPPVPAIVGPTVDLTDGQIQSAITNGVRYTGMPSFSKVLSPDEVWKAVLWVRQLNQSPPAPQPSLPSDTAPGVSSPTAPTAEKQPKP